MFDIESHYLLHSPAETIIIKDKAHDPKNGILLFYQVVNNSSANRICINQDLLMIRTVKELHFVPCTKENDKTNNSTIYMHKSKRFAARKLKDELVIFSNKENQFLFIRDHSNKLDDLGRLFDSNQTLSENLTSAVKAGVVARDAHYGLLALSLLDKNSHKEIYDISKMFN